MDQTRAKDETNCFTCLQIRFYFQNGVISDEERKILLEEHRKEVQSVTAK